MCFHTKAVGRGGEVLRKTLTNVEMWKCGGGGSLAAFGVEIIPDSVPTQPDAPLVARSTTFLLLNKLRTTSSARLTTPAPVRCVSG